MLTTSSPPPLLLLLLLPPPPPPPPPLLLLATANGVTRQNDGFRYRKGRSIQISSALQAPVT
jgi:hypothetical protein